ncbi:MAG: NAD(P)/FAD-dependent oxidoreductase [Pseudomonadota bacterium]
MDVTAYDAIVFGAGGAGLMAAAVAGERGRKVLVVDHADKAGKKILISGGGRCNFTNLDIAPDRFLSENRHFAKSALRRYTQHDFIALVDRTGIAWHEKTLGQLFCDGSARQIVDMLLDECARAGVVVQLGSGIRDVSHSDGRFEVLLESGLRTVAPSLVIATGGPSIPKMGATGFAYDLARQFGLKIVPPRPALVPFTLAEAGVLFGGVTGLATDVIARCGEAAFKEACLFTHKGLSGPAILQVSSYWRPGDWITLDFAPAHPSDWLVTIKTKHPRIGLRAALSQIMPDRLAHGLSDRLGLEGSLANVPDKTLREAQAQLSSWRFMPSGTEGYAKAEVTAGGIDTAELSSRTMEAKSVPGLYCIGEAVDVTGWLGGYNFQWAWSSGWAAGQVI